jgi:hypothetical protein
MPPVLVHAMSLTNEVLSNLAVRVTLSFGVRSALFGEIARLGDGGVQPDKYIAKKEVMTQKLFLKPFTF